jgi:hypothetical protein
MLTVVTVRARVSTPNVTVITTVAVITTRVTVMTTRCGGHFNGIDSAINDELPFTAPSSAHAKK